MRAKERSQIFLSLQAYLPENAEIKLQYLNALMMSLETTTQREFALLRLLELNTTVSIDASNLLDKIPLAGFLKLYPEDKRAQFLENIKVNYKNGFTLPSVFTRAQLCSILKVLKKQPTLQKLVYQKFINNAQAKIPSILPYRNLFSQDTRAEIFREEVERMHSSLT
jgi:hypothetical protein